MDEIKPFSVSIYPSGAASPVAEMMTARKVNGHLQDQGGEDQLQGRDDNLLICVKLGRIWSPEAGDHITFSLFLLSSNFLLPFTGISARLRKLFLMILLEQTPHVTGGMNRKLVCAHLASGSCYTSNLIP